MVKIYILVIMMRLLDGGGAVKINFLDKKSCEFEANMLITESKIDNKKPYMKAFCVEAIKEINN